MKTILAILIIVLSLPINAATFSADRIEEACRTFLIQKYGNDYQIDFLSKFKEINIDNDNVKAIFDDHYTAYNNGVKLEFVVNNKVIKTQIFFFFLKKEITVFKAKSYIPANTDITNSMIIRDNEFVELDKIENYLNPVGRVATKSIYQEETLTTLNTLPDVTVKRGEEIVVVATNGAVTIRGIGTALQDGRVGESIKVKRGDSKKILTGKLNESGELILGE